MLVDKLQVIEDKFMDLEQRISDPEVIARQDEWRKLTRQHAQLSETVETFRTYKKVLSGIDEAMEVIEDKSMDEEFREMAQEELKDLKPQKEELEEKENITIYPMFYKDKEIAKEFVETTLKDTWETADDWFVR